MCGCKLFNVFLILCTSNIFYFTCNENIESSVILEIAGVEVDLRNDKPIKTFTGKQVSVTTRAEPDETIFFVENYNADFTAGQDMTKTAAADLTELFSKNLNESFGKDEHRFYVKPKMYLTRKVEDENETKYESQYK